MCCFYLLISLNLGKLNKRTNMSPDELVKHYGNQVKAAAEIGVSENTVRNWLVANKVPTLVQLAVQTLTKGKLKAD